MRMTHRHCSPRSTCCTSVSRLNGLVSAEENVSEKWAQVENVYQRRADLVPNLVETV